MQITVKAFGVVRASLGQKEFVLNVPEGATVRYAIERVIELGDADSRNIIFSPDGNSLKVRAVVSGQPVALDSALSDGDELALMFTIGGGC